MKPSPAPDPEFPTTRSRPGKIFLKPPSDEQVRKAAEALGAPTGERDTLPLEGE